ncbi:SIMPL domain-containing protein [Lysinibacillus fusiformis]
MYYAQLPHQASIPPRVITVTGTGQVKAKPSAMQLQIEVQTQGQNVQEPQQKNAATMKQVIQSITALGIPSEQIQTAAYTITPLYHFEDGTNKFSLVMK